MTENLPNMKDMNINIEEAQYTPSKMNSKDSHRTHYNHIFKRQRQRKKILKAARKKITSRFLIGNMEPIRQWVDIFKVLKE